MAIYLNAKARSAIKLILSQSDSINLLKIVQSVGNGSIYGRINNLVAEESVSELKSRLFEKANAFIDDFVCDESKVVSLYTGREGLDHDKTVENLMFKELFIENNSDFDKEALEKLLVSMNNCTLHSQKQITISYTGFSDGKAVASFGKKYEAEEFKSKASENYFKESLTLNLDDCLVKFLDSTSAETDEEKQKFLVAFIWLYVIADQAAGRLSNKSSFAYELYTNGVVCENKESWLDLIGTMKAFCEANDVAIEDSANFATELIKLTSKDKNLRVR